MPATVRISETGRQLLAQLARESGASMTSVLDTALEAYRRQRFLETAAEAYEALAADPQAAKDYRDELIGLDGTSADGLDSYAP